MPEHNVDPESVIYHFVYIMQLTFFRQAEISQAVQLLHNLAECMMIVANTFSLQNVKVKDEFSGVSGLVGLIAGNS